MTWLQHDDVDITCVVLMNVPTPLVLEVSMAHSVRFDRNFSNTRQAHRVSICESGVEFAPAQSARAPGQPFNQRYLQVVDGPLQFPGQRRVAHISRRH